MLSLGLRSRKHQRCTNPTLGDDESLNAAPTFLLSLTKIVFDQHPSWIPPFKVLVSPFSKKVIVSNSLSVTRLTQRSCYKSVALSS